MKLRQTNEQTVHLHTHTYTHKPTHTHPRRGTDIHWAQLVGADVAVRCCTTRSTRAAELEAATWHGRVPGVQYENMPAPETTRAVRLAPLASDYGSPRPSWSPLRWSATRSAERDDEEWWKSYFPTLQPKTISTWCYCSISRAPRSRGCWGWATDLCRTRQTALSPTLHGCPHPAVYGSLGQAKPLSVDRERAGSSVCRWAKRFVLKLATWAWYTDRFYTALDRPGGTEIREELRKRRGELRIFILIMFI